MKSWILYCMLEVHCSLQFHSKCFDIICTKEGKVLEIWLEIFLLHLMYTGFIKVGVHVKAVLLSS